jgi:hypothetical protein
MLGEVSCGYFVYMLCKPDDDLLGSKQEDKKMKVYVIKVFFYLPTDAQENFFNLLAPEFYI